MNARAFDLREEARELDRRADSILEIASRVRGFFVANTDLIATTCEVAGFFWYRQESDRRHVAGAFDERGRRCFVRTRDALDDAFRDVLSAIADDSRERARRCREEADELDSETTSADAA